MASKSGITLMEMVVALVIVGIAAAMTLPTFTATMEVTKAQAAKQNLMAISAAEQNYFETSNPQNYCTSTTPVITPACGDNNTDLNTNLHLSLADSFTYNCLDVPVNTPAAGNPERYTCTAADGTDTLTLAPNLDTTGTQVLGFNVTCATTGPNSSYCP